MQPVLPVRTDESPREVIAHDFKSLKGGLPISGGWGYTKDTACVIERVDPLVNPETPFHGVAYEYKFIELRNYEELIICRPLDQRFAGVRWRLIEQSVSGVEDGRRYDRLEYELTAFSDADWEELKAEYTGPNGIESPDFDREAHERKRAERMIRWNRECWFDITSFFGKETYPEPVDYVRQSPRNVSDPIID